MLNAELEGICKEGILKVNRKYEKSKKEFEERVLEAKKELNLCKNDIKPEAPNLFAHADFLYFVETLKPNFYLGGFYHVKAYVFEKCGRSFEPVCDFTRRLAHPRPQFHPSGRKRKYRDI